jgi:uncharacterized membrane protein YtjA (UPF0391 family)
LKILVGIINEETGTGREGEGTMLNWTILFLIIAVLAGILGFSGIAGVASEMAKITFIVFLAFFAISYLLGRRPPVT